jgi:hypothetical protein
VPEEEGLEGNRASDGFSSGDSDRDCQNSDSGDEDNSMNTGKSDSGDQRDISMNIAFFDPRQRRPSLSVCSEQAASSETQSRQGLSHSCLGPWNCPTCTSRAVSTMYVFMYACMSVCMDVWMYRCVCVCVYIYIYIYIYMYIYIYIYVYVNIYRFSGGTAGAFYYIYSHIFTYIPIYLHRYIGIYIYIYIDIMQIYVCIDVCMHV